ncbi:hypothetical protein JW707_05005 [Candidatus Woesearchaeota archaeon]|nr:hypothetical protein [Candidatus Woesearchaeota archaeon]
MAFPGAGGGGSYSAEGELYKDVFEQLQKEKQQEEQATKIQQGEIKREHEEQEEQEAETQAIKKTMTSEIKRKIKEIRSTIPSTTKILICLVVALIYDIVDIIISIVTLFSSEAGEWAADIPMQIFFSFMLGKYYKKMALMEFIPFLDVMPWYTISVIMSWRAVRKEKGEIKSLKKEAKELGGAGRTKRPGFLGVEKKGWTFILALTGFATISFYLMNRALAIMPIVIFLVIVFLLALRDPDSRGIAIGLFLTVLVIGALGSIVFFVVAPLLGGQNFGGPLGDAISSANVAGQGFKNTLAKLNPINAIQTYYQKQLYKATGDYYTGKVDENAQAKLGVYLEDIKQADPVFYENRPVTLYATLIVQTLDEAMNVDLYCKSDRQKRDVTPKIFPQESFLVDIYDERDIDCKFESGELEKGAQTVTLGAKFNFKTMSYVKSYFMDLDRLRSMRREEIDPLEQYGITEKEPIATYTVGPVGIGMSVGKPPVGIDLNEPQTTLTLGITIENNWDGMVTQINRMVVIVPKGFELIDIGANYSQALCIDLPKNESLLCNDDENNVYVVTTDNIGELYTGNFKSYRGYMRVNKANYDKILGVSPISTKYFKVTVDYTYNLEKEKVIDVKAVQPTSIVAGASETYDITPPKIEHFRAVKQEGGSVVVSWQTDEPSNDIFEYFETLRPYSVFPTPNEVTFDKSHSRNLGSIGTTGYSYRLITEDVNGNKDEKTGELAITGG